MFTASAGALDLGEMAQMGAAENPCFPPGANGPRVCLKRLHEDVRRELARLGTPVNSPVVARILCAANGTLLDLFPQPRTFKRT